MSDVILLRCDGEKSEAIPSGLQQQVGFKPDSGKPLNCSHPNTVRTQPGVPSGYPPISRPTGLCRSTERRRGATGPGVGVGGGPRPTPVRRGGEGVKPRPGGGAGTRGPAPADREVSRACAVSSGYRPGGSARRGESGLRGWGRRSVSVIASFTPAPCGRTGLGERPPTRPGVADPGVPGGHRGPRECGPAGRRRRRRVVWAGGVRREGPESPLYREAGAPRRPSRLPPARSAHYPFALEKLGVLLLVTGG